MFQVAAGLDLRPDCWTSQWTTLDERGIKDFTVLSVVAGLDLRPDCWTTQRITLDELGNKDFTDSRLKPGEKSSSASSQKSAEPSSTPKGTPGAKKIPRFRIVRKDGKGGKSKTRILEEIDSSDESECSAKRAD